MRNLHCAEIMLVCPGYEPLRVHVEVLTTGSTPGTFSVLTALHALHLFCDPESTFTTMLNAAMDDDTDDDQPFEWVVHKEYIQVLWSSDDPLLQILAHIEDVDGTLCALGQRLEDERTFSLGMIDALEDYAAECLAVATMSFLEQIANSCLPTLFGHLHTSRHMLAYAWAQVQSFPTLVACQDVPCNTNEDFRVLDPHISKCKHGIQCLCLSG